MTTTTKFFSKKQLESMSDPVRDIYAIYKSIGRRKRLISRLCEKAWDKVDSYYMKKRVTHRKCAEVDEYGRFILGKYMEDTVGIVYHTFSWANQPQSRIDYLNNYNYLAKQKDALKAIHKRIEMILCRYLEGRRKVKKSKYLRECYAVKKMLENNQKHLTLNVV